jgi:hypothetical protein
MIRIEGVTRAPRNEMIARVSRAIQDAGADILDSRFYSNLSMFVAGEIAWSKIGMLSDLLAGTGLRLNERSIEAMQQPNAGQDRLVAFHLVVVFVHDEPDLRIAVPAVPG